MTTSRYTTGNLARDVMIMAALVEAKKHGHPLNLANVGLALPKDFELDQSELDGILANMGGNLPAIEPEAPPEAGMRRRTRRTLPSRNSLR